MPSKAKRNRKSVEQSALAPNGATKFLVQGQISRPDNQRLAGLIVCAFDKEMRSEEQLRKAITDKIRRYESKLRGLPVGIRGTRATGARQPLAKIKQH
jgi:hypothetical protein